MLLLIETATKICSVGITHNGQLLTLQEKKEGFNHASQLTLLIAAACEAAQVTLTDMDAVAVSIGPGSYTGLRIGLSTAKGICYGLGKPLIAIETLKSLFQASLKTPELGNNPLFVPMIDARRMEVCTQFYNQEGEITEAQHALILTENTFENALTAYSSIVFSGDGAEKCKSLFDAPNFIYTDILCSANNLADLAEQYFETGNFADLAYIEPAYFKPPNITKSKKKVF